MKMQSVKSYMAYYDDGLFVPYETVTIPNGCQVVVTVLDFPSAIIKEADPSKSAVGLWEGEATIPDDFNEPLEDLKEYMY